MKQIHNIAKSLKSRLLLYIEVTFVRERERERRRERERKGEIETMYGIEW